MKKSTELFLANFLYPLLVVAVVAAASMIYSRVSTGDFLAYFAKLRLYQWLLITIAVFLTFAMAKIVSIAKQPLTSSTLHSGPTQADNTSYQELGEHLYQGVLWPVLQRATLRSDVVPSPDDFRVDIPPRCPNCKTDLDERKIFGGRLVWSCPRGDFRTTSSISYLAMQETVQKLVRGTLRK